MIGAVIRALTSCVSVEVAAADGALVGASVTAGTTTGLYVRADCVISLGTGVVSGRSVIGAPAVC